jgi:hypothetical protein
MLVNLFFLSSRLRESSAQVVSSGMLNKCGKDSVGGDEVGKKAKTTPDAGRKSVSQKSQATRTCSNLFEKSESKQTEFFFKQSP